jgi:hypothetical protein
MKYVVLIAVLCFGNSLAAQNFHEYNKRCKAKDIVVLPISEIGKNKVVIGSWNVPRDKEIVDINSLPKKTVRKFQRFTKSKEACEIYVDFVGDFIYHYNGKRENISADFIWIYAVKEVFPITDNTDNSRAEK